MGAPRRGRGTADRRPRPSRRRHHPLRQDGTTVRDRPALVFVQNDTETELRGARDPLEIPHDEIAEVTATVPRRSVTNLRRLLANDSRGRFVSRLLEVTTTDGRTHHWYLRGLTTTLAAIDDARRP